MYLGCPLMTTKPHRIERPMDVPVCTQQSRAISPLSEMTDTQPPQPPPVLLTVTSNDKIRPINPQLSPHSRSCITAVSHGKAPPNQNTTSYSDETAGERGVYLVYLVCDICYC